MTISDYEMIRTAPMTNAEAVWTFLDLFSSETQPYKSHNVNRKVFLFCPIV